MATSTPIRAPSTPPPAAPRVRTRKPSAKLLETRQSQRTQTTATQLRQARTRATASQPHAEAPSNTQQQTDDELLPFPTQRESVSPVRGGGSAKLDEVIQLIASLRDTIAEQSNIIASQNSIIESIRTNLSAIKAEQQYLKNQNAELQEMVESLRAQLDTLLIEPLSTQTWATVAVSGRPAGPSMMSARSMNPGTADKENSRQLVIDVSKVREGVAERVATTEAAKQAIQQGMNGMERLAGVTVKDFRMWRANDSTSVIKFSMDKDKEAVFRQTTDEWLEPQIPGARLVGPKWYPVKVDFIKVTLAMDAESGKVSKSAMERFGTENRVEVCTMRWLGQPRPSGQHASVVIKVATKEQAEKLLRSDSVMFGGGGIMISLFKE